MYFFYSIRVIAFSHTQRNSPPLYNIVYYNYWKYIFLSFHTSNIAISESSVYLSSAPWYTCLHGRWNPPVTAISPLPIPLGYLDRHSCWIPGPALCSMALETEPWFRSRLLDVVLTSTSAFYRVNVKQINIKRQRKINIHVIRQCKLTY